MSFITRILESILPFLFSALKRTWDNLTSDQQKALTNSGIIGQYLKNNLTALGSDLVKAIASHTNLPESEVQSALLDIAGKFGLTTTEVDKAVAFLQAKLQEAEGTPLWNGILSTLLNVGGTILSGGTIDWVHVALGLGEYVFQTYVKPVQLLGVGPVNAQLSETNQVSDSQLASERASLKNIPGQAFTETAQVASPPVDPDAGKQG